MHDRLSLFVAWWPFAALAVTCAGDEAIRSRLIEGSTLVDACPACARPEVEIRLIGVLDVVPASSNPLFTRWQLVNLQFTDGSATPGSAITGEGWIEIGGEVAVVQRGRLDIVLRTDNAQRRAVLSCPPGPVERVWPMWKAGFVQTDGAPTSEIRLTLAVAPVRKLWFNTRHGLTSGVGQWPANRVRPADILSETGRRVHDGSALFAAAGVTGEQAEQADIDAFEVESAPPGRLLFSPDRDVRSSLLGVIREGDVVAVEGPASLFRQNEVLLQSFEGCSSSRTWVSRRRNRRNLIRSRGARIRLCLGLDPAGSFKWEQPLSPANRSRTKVRCSRAGVGGTKGAR